MIEKVKSLFRRSTKLLRSKAEHTESDVTIASFPKSGRNWVIFLLANSMLINAGRDDDVHFKNNTDFISATDPQPPPIAGAYPRIVADHSEHDGRDVRVIYLLRHPADVMESYYVYQRDRWNDPVGDFESFIRDENWGVPAWSSHVKSWEESIDVLVTFEGLKANAGDQLRSMYTLFCEDIDDVTVEEAVERSSFENMAQMEEKYGVPEKKGANSNFRFMRKGKAAQGAEYFRDADYRYLWKEAGDVMSRYGYDVPVEVEI
ncbi:hypothetical protein GGP86_003065 [Salinibacter ruber]|uniref:sulfotransferase domain-containing protein n=1 Tax=Salinibacter ruber TaxID=146919 RepID=UPI0021692E4F|nr:sulfotransferase domain-containing protein [Salinibacter ruber]MCS3863269.1 hypothetical protein [Salinibacter ruber]